MLRRLFQTQFENFWPKYSYEQQTTLKQELLTRLTQFNDDEIIRKKICYVTAELARNLIGIKNKKEDFILKLNYFFM